MEIKKYKEEILKKILYSLEEVIFSKEKENNFQYATYLFNTKIKYIDKKKTQYKLIFEIKDILNNKVLFLWEWFVDENKNVKTFLEFQSKIKKLANYEGNNFSDEFELIEQYTAFENTSKDFDTIQIVIENTENLDFKNEIDSTQLQNELKKWNYYLVKEEKVENEYIYTFSNTKEIRDEKQPSFMIKQK